MTTAILAAGRSRRHDGELERLREEHISQADFAGLRLVKENAQGAVEKGLTGKPAYARITRIFEPTGTLTAQQGLQTIAEAARVEGFTLHSETSTGLTFTKPDNPDANSRRIELKALAAPHEGKESVFLYLTLY